MAMAGSKRWGCAAAMWMLPLAGCSFFGIDTRPDIEYATITERRPVKEPMYQRQIPGTNLVKRWPAKRGLAYGYAPWEKKQDAVMVSQQNQPGETPATANGGQPPSPHASLPAAPPGRKTVKSARVDSQVQQAADWSPRHEGAAAGQASAPRRLPVRDRQPADEPAGGPRGLIQPRTVAPVVGQADSEGGEEAPVAPQESTSNLPNVYDPSDAQGTPEDEG
jgi:hypothetical protein